MSEQQQTRVFRTQDEREQAVDEIIELLKEHHIGDFDLFPEEKNDFITLADLCYITGMHDSDVYRFSRADGPDYDPNFPNRYIFYIFNGTTFSRTLYFNMEEVNYFIDNHYNYKHYSSKTIQKEVKSFFKRQ